MRTIFSISFALVLCAEAFLPNMDRCELKKVESLFEHYQKSCEEGESCLFNFLLAHYGADNKSTACHQAQHDGDLPFQGKACCQPPLFIPEQLTFSCAFSVPITPVKYSFYTQQMASEFPDAIFQPPKVLNNAVAAPVYQA